MASHGVIAVINNWQLTHLGNVKQTRYDLQLEGHYRYHLPASLPVMTMNRWGCRLKSLTIHPCIKNIEDHPDYSVSVVTLATAKEPESTKVFKLSDYTGHVASVFELVDILSEIWDGTVGNSMTYNGRRLVFKVGAKYKIILGKKIYTALGFYGCCERWPTIKCLDNGGGMEFSHRGKDGYIVYGTHTGFNRVFVPKVLNICSNVTEPIPTGNGFLPLLYTCSITDEGTCSAAEGSYRKISQSPIDSIDLTFYDEKGKKIVFSTFDKSDFIFVIELEFKKLVDIE